MPVDVSTYSLSWVKESPVKWRLGPVGIEMKIVMVIKLINVEFVIADKWKGAAINQ